MNIKKWTLILIIAALLVLVSSMAQADDGAMFRRNVSRTPDGETEDALISMMDFYVPAQAADGTLTPIDYYDANGALIETRDQAKPLIVSYIDDIGEHEDGEYQITGGIGFGMRDTFTAHSLDDGATWKQINISNAADLSSFTLADGTEYPGDAVAAVHAVADNYIMTAWLSKYCDGGLPAYTWTDDNGDPLYDDFFGVAGTQQSVDYTLQGFPEIGEIPYSCVWSARGTLELQDDGTYDVLWRKAERLTSGRRDANRVEVAAANKAGFILVWQEDPEGLRPGQGLGPGEGWSGAIVNSKTDIWYSYIPWDDFALVDPEIDPEQKPQVLVPMTVPIRLTDNNMCKYPIQPDPTGGIINAYCYEDFNDNGTADFCAETVPWQNPGGTTLDICKTEDERVLWGRVGASRPRIGLITYTTSLDTTSAWVVLAYEETKALGSGPEDIDPIDIGKEIWYHTFEMNTPEIVSTGHILNEPAHDPETGAFFEIQVDEWGNEFYETEIARRFSMIVQHPVYVGAEETTMLALFKQGIINQGGPADIMGRRFVLPEDYDPTTDNPYLFENMVCETWAYRDTYNPNYPGGICLEPAINLSSPNMVSCDPECTPFYQWEDPPGSLARVQEWLQTEDNLDDQSWENPYDVAKGHRGFIDGDFIMMMYAWSPNWQTNAVGNDKYNLYVRRSFDGGMTWTTTPADLGGTGTEHCENYLNQDDPVCTTYAAGEFEQAWNVSQLTSTKITILDPRFTPTPHDILTDGSPTYEDDIRDPSRYYIVYETGDNTTVAEGEATPLDLFYSRADVYGDTYYLVEYTASDGTIYEGWDWLEKQHEDLSGEASVRTNPAGNFFYAVWSQWQEPEEDVIENSDAWFRRVWLNDLVDSMPSVTGVWYLPHSAGYNTGGTIGFAGTAKDNDRLGNGIVGHRWLSSLDGTLSTERAFTIDVTAMSTGRHVISFNAQDNEGNWAQPHEFLYLVADELHLQYLPAVFTGD